MKFTKEQAALAAKAARRLFMAISPTKRLMHHDDFNSVLEFIAAAEPHAESEERQRDIEVVCQGK